MQVVYSRRDGSAGGGAGRGTEMRRGRTWGTFKHIRTAGSCGSAPPCTCGPGKAVAPLVVLSLRVKAGVVLTHQLPSVPAVGCSREGVTPLHFRPLKVCRIPCSSAQCSWLLVMRSQPLSCPHHPIEFSALGFSNCLQLLEKLLLISFWSYTHSSFSSSFSK